MASRTSTTTGTWIGLAILGMLTLGLIILSVISIATSQKLNNELQAAQSDLDDAVRQTERGDRWEELKIASGNSKGVVFYLDEQIQDTMSAVTGLRRDSVAKLQEQITNAYGEDAPPLMDILSQRDSRIAALERQLAGVEIGRAHV